MTTGETATEAAMDALARPALQLLGHVVEETATPRDDVTIGFFTMEGGAFVLNASQKPALREDPSAAHAADTQVLCNGAGLMGLLTGSLGAADQIFLCRGDESAFVALAMVLERKQMNTLALRMSQGGGL